MIVLGIDPGSRAMGWGVVRSHGSEVRHVAHGVFRPKGADLHARLDAIYQEVGRLVREFKPAAAAVEDVFVHKNVKSAMVLAGARTAAVLAAMELVLAGQVLHAALPDTSLYVPTAQLVQAPPSGP